MATANVGLPILTGGEPYSLKTIHNNLSNAVDSAFGQVRYYRGTAAARAQFVTDGKAQNGDSWQDTDGEKRAWFYNGTAWIPNLGRFGRAQISTDTVLGGSTGWTDITSGFATTITSSFPMKITYAVSAYNANSGSARTATYRVICDSTSVGPTIDSDIPLGGGGGRSYGQSSTFFYEYTPSAGTHTWKLQGQASAASAVSVNRAVLIVEAA